MGGESRPIEGVAVVMNQIRYVKWRHIPIDPVAFLQDVHPYHPPDKEYRDDGPGNVNDPVAGCFRFSKIEHSAMVAGL